MNSADPTNERPRAVSVNSPLSCFLKSATSKEDSCSSDFSRSWSEAGLIYDYCSQNLLQKAKSIKKSNQNSVGSSSYLRSAKSSEVVAMKYGLTRSQTLPTTTKDSNNTLGPKIATRSSKPKVMKYVQDFSACFEKLESLTFTSSLPNSVTYYKAEHSLDGQTYLLRKNKIFIGQNEEIQEHPAYKEISQIKDCKASEDIQYVNSWVELDRESDNLATNQTRSGLYVLLCIQMRYFKDFVTLNRDLVVPSLPARYMSSDEDTISTSESIDVLASELHH